MATRITKIKVQNCRVYNGFHNLLELQDGQNLLIYGENGSGKSSIFKGLKAYFSSSTDSSIAFPINSYSEFDEGFVRITFGEFDLNQELIPGPQREFQFGNRFSNNNQNFIEVASFLGGFLDYTDLLKVYLHDTPDPNLFDLIVLHLLGQQVPFNTGGNFRFKPKWHQLQHDLRTAHTRRTYRHQAALNELPRYETHLRSVLDSVFGELNRLLTQYFEDLNIELGYRLEPITYRYGHRSQWNINSELFLVVLHDGDIIDHHNDFLNEARLSAFSICLYLASLLCNPSPEGELKLLYLDDVFVGLDAGNRRPILEILRVEFEHYQKIISTYDRHWYELARKQFEVIPNSNWTCVEFYVGKKTFEDKIITDPIIVTGATHFEKAIQHLSDRLKPDYPAAANYFRKYLEELITQHIPKFELTDSEFTQIPGYRLGTLMKKTQAFFTKTDNDPSNIQTIFQYLNVLIHPLSHHDITSPIYKTELIVLQNAIRNLENQLLAIRPNSRFQCVLDPGIQIRMKIELNSILKYVINYTITLLEPLIISLDTNGNPILAKCKCYTNICEGEKNGASLQSFHPTKKDPRFQYTSLEHAYDMIYTFNSQFSDVTETKNMNFLNDISYFNGIDWKPIQPKISWT